MQLVRLIFLLLVTGFIAGCNPPNPPPTLNTDTIPNEPTHAQPKLATIKLFIGAETLDAEQALTEEQEQTGMMFRTNIQDTDAMIFVLPGPQRASFWMKNCPESISCAYITADGVIQEIHHLEQNDTNAVLAARNDIEFVLETNEGWFNRHHIATGTVISTERGSLAQVYLHN